MNKPISQIPWCTSPVFHNTPIGDRNVHVSVENGVLWDIEPVISELCGTVLYTTTTQSVRYFITVQLSSITKFTLPREQSHPILSNLTTSYYVISHHISHMSHPVRSYQITTYHIPYYYTTSHDIIFYHITYTTHKKFMNTCTSAESVASFILEGRYLGEPNIVGCWNLEYIISHGPLTDSHIVQNKTSKLPLKSLHNTTA